MAGKGEPKTRVLREPADEVAKKTRSYKKSPARVVVPPSPGRMRAKSPGRRVGPKSPSPSRLKSAPKSPTKSTPTKRAVGRPKSPSRKSPARKSPSRKSPVRRSPGRPRSTGRSSKSPSLTNFNFTTKTPTDNPIVEIVDDSDSDDDFLVKPKAFLGRETTPVRRSSRLRDYERVVHLKTSYEPIPKLPEFSDEDDPEIQQAIEAQCAQPAPAVRKANYAQIFGAVSQMFMIPALFFSMLLLCNELQCNFAAPDLTRFRQLDTYFELPVFLSFTAYVLLITILSALPFGGKKCYGLLNKQGKLHYVMNGFFSAMILLAIAVGMSAQGIDVWGYLQEHFLKLSVSGFILALPLAIVLHVKSLYAPISSLKMSALKSSGLINFFYGSEVNPRIYGVVDVKMLLFRIGFISVFLMACSFLGGNVTWDKSLQLQDALALFKSIRFNPSVLMINAMFIVYCLDALVFEHHWLSSKEIQYESVGYMKCLEMFCFVPLYTMIPKYVYDFGAQLPWYSYLFSGVSFVAGYVLFRCSNSQKHKFRQNPYSPSVAHLESIPTSMGKNLICSGYWGLVRHPNYLGDILMNVSYLPFVLCYPPCIVIYTAILFLVQRAHDDNKRCKERYGTAWDRYCQRVKYILIPKVY